MRALCALEQSILEKRTEVTSNLTSWQRVQLSRHPDRPYTQKYIQKMTTNFVELLATATCATTKL
jgi:acetyl-CoA carboxylase carboxyl transferase subunit alpha